MSRPLSRRDALKQLGAAGAALAHAKAVIRGRAGEITIAGQPVEIAVGSVSPSTVRITVSPLQGGHPLALRRTEALARPDAGRHGTRGRQAAAFGHVRAGNLIVRYSEGPPTIYVDDANGTTVQRLTFDAVTTGMSFSMGAGPLLGLGEGGPQFDRRGSVDRMVSGQDGGRGYRLATHGTRAPIQWLIGTGGWAMFVHQPYGAFDFTGPEAAFLPDAASPLPIDVFVVSSRDPAVIMREYARITGYPEMPALWTFGYQQSHRTLAGPDEILGVARTFREKKLPCDALIYLGTEFAPSGWNTRNGEFTWHPTNFPKPREMLDTLHAEHFKVVLHVVVEGRQLTGTVHDPCTAPPLPSGRTPDGHWPPVRQVACYWPFHKPLVDVGVDGWWPDQGDNFDAASELNRHRMYWDGSQLYRPNERPYALHRNASAGVQRYGGFIWSGDISTRWETLKTHVSVAINTGLSGLPYWGTDIGGFSPTAEYTAELHVRWFQFGAFCPLFRAHGRNWHLRLPWGWDGGDGGPPESGRFRIDPAQLRNPEVEAICRDYLELRYRLMPYLYTAVRECHDSGMPIMRSCWLHHPDDAVAAGLGDQYYWGPDLIVAPVVEKGATSRTVYLPRGSWWDFWTEERIEGGRHIERRVDLKTMPLYVRAGAVIPMGPVRQYVDEPSDEPMALVIYPGDDGASSWYEDDGRTFNYRRGDSMRTMLTWRDADRMLSLRLVAGSRAQAPWPRSIVVRVAGGSRTSTLNFTGRPTSMSM
jgi:alpha-glucosidase (family GH31 glycosyl hydrolase)